MNKQSGVFFVLLYTKQSFGAADFCTFTESLLGGDIIDSQDKRNHEVKPSMKQLYERLLFVIHFFVGIFLKFSTHLNALFIAKLFKDET